MTDGLEPGDPLDRMVNALRQPVPIVPGLARRAGERLHRRRRTRVVRGIVAVLLVGLIAVALQRHSSGTPVTQATVKLHPGRYRFAYLVDHDQWRADARAATAPDDFGRPTSILTVVGN